MLAEGRSQKSLDDASWKSVEGIVRGSEDSEGRIGVGKRFNLAGGRNGSHQCRKSRSGNGKIDNGCSLKLTLNLALEGLGRS